MFLLIINNQIFLHSLGKTLLWGISIIDSSVYSFTLININQSPLAWLLLGSLIGGNIGVILGFQKIKQYS